MDLEVLRNHMLLWAHTPGPFLLDTKGYKIFDGHLWSANYILGSMWARKQKKTRFHLVTKLSMWKAHILLYTMNYSRWCMWGDLTGTVEGPKLLSHGSSKVGIQDLLHPIAQRHASISRRCGEAMGRSSIVGNNVSSYPIRNRHVTKMAWPGWNSWKTPNEVFEISALYHLYMAYHLLAACCQNHTYVACEALSITSLAGFPRAQKPSVLSTLHKSSLQTLSKALEYVLLIKCHTQPSPAHLHLQWYKGMSPFLAARTIWKTLEFGTSHKLPLCKQPSEYPQNRSRCTWRYLEDCEDPNRLHRLQRPHQYTLACSWMSQAHSTSYCKCSTIHNFPAVQLSCPFSSLIQCQKYHSSGYYWSTWKYCGHKVYYDSKGGWLCQPPLFSVFDPHG